MCCTMLCYAVLSISCSLPSSFSPSLQGERLRSEIRGFGSPIVQEVRGKGLLNAVVIEDRSTDQSYAWNICMRLAELGE